MKIVRIIGNLLMAIVMIMASMGITVNNHYCGGKLVESSFFVKPAHDHCQKMHKQNENQRSLHESMHSTDDNCCSESTDYYQLIDLVKISKISLELKIFSFDTDFTYSITDPSADLEYFPSFNQYKPPLIEQDLPVFVQSLLL